MPPYESLIVLTLGALAGIAMLAGAGAWGWGRWVQLKRLELARASDDHRTDRDDRAPIAGRIELADLRERVRKLEAIAAGVDL